jgi:hypothetical protein
LALIASPPIFDFWTLDNPCLHGAISPAPDRPASSASLICQRSVYLAGIWLGGLLVAWAHGE